MFDTTCIKALATKLAENSIVQLAAGCTDADVRSFELRTHLQLPIDLERWLRLTNGPRIGPRWLSVSSNELESSIERIMNLDQHWKFNHWIPFASDGCGNYYFVATRGEFGGNYPVFFIDSIGEPETPTYAVASEIGKAIELLLTEELDQVQLQFDREYLMSHDPELANLKGIPLPWEID